MQPHSIRDGDHYRGSERPCDLCHKPFRPRADATPGHGLYCSRSCANKVNRRKRTIRAQDGHRFIDRYVMVRVGWHPAAKETGYVYEHRLVMEAHIGRFLASAEHVHHINGDKLDNRLDNLRVVNHVEHIREHRPEYEPARLAGLAAAHVRKWGARHDRVACKVCSRVA